MQVTHLCQATNSLPEAGGLYDQDSYLMEAMTLVMAIQGAKTEDEMKKLQAQMKDVSSAPRR